MTELKDYEAIFEPELLKEIEHLAVKKVFDAGEVIMDIGSTIRSIPLLITGAVKVLREDEDGDELLLYFLERGESCAMTLNCCIRNSKSEIRAIAETKTQILFIPIIKMEEWSEKYRSWRNFVFESYNLRFSELLETIDKIAFLNMDERLIAFLIEKSEVNNSLVIEQTHQEIASELNTSRVVISRLLKKLEKTKRIELHRNKIKILDLL